MTISELGGGGFAKAMVTCLERKKVGGEAPRRLSAGLVAEAAPDRQSQFHPGRSSVPAAASWKQSRGGRRYPLLRSASRGQRAGPTVPDSQGWRGRSSCALGPGLLSRTPGPRRWRSRACGCGCGCGTASRPQGGWAEGVGPRCAGPIRAVRGAGTTSPGPRGGESPQPKGYGAELGASWGSCGPWAPAGAGGAVDARWWLADYDTAP